MIGDMKAILDKVITECLSRGLSIETSIAPNGTIGHKVKGFSKSGEAFIFADEENKAVICETRYGQIDHILSFRDLAYVAYYWYLDYKDRNPFEEPESEWKPIFDEFFKYSGYTKENENLNPTTSSVVSDRRSSFVEDGDYPF